MRPAPTRLDLKWELLPIFLVILSFSLGFIFYGHRLDALAKTGESLYGVDWGNLQACVEWGIPAGALLAYLLLSLGTWAVGSVADPLKDWNAMLRLAGRPPIVDPERREAARARLLHALFLCKGAFGFLVLFAQWAFFQWIGGRLGLGGP